MSKRRNQIYLSSAFTKRTDEELEFLGAIDGATGFSLFWIDVVKPLLCELKAKYLLEVGADKGNHTTLLLQYCDTFDATLIVIEPVVTPSLQKIVSSSTRVRLYAEKSQTALPRVDSPVDAVLLEGDLNYYAVQNALLAIEQLSRRQNIAFPIVFVNSTSWPYARRDMYYDPDSIPEAERHEHARSGMTPWSSQLEDGAINYPFANAKSEGGPKNGVLTAVEDFIRESPLLPLRFFSLPVNHGLGIIFTESSRVEEFIRINLLPPPLLGRFLETFELARLNDIIRRLQSQQSQPQAQRDVRARLGLILRRLGRQMIRMIEQ